MMTRDMKHWHERGFHQQDNRNSNDISYLRKKATAGLMAFGSYRQPVPPPLLPRVDQNQYCTMTNGSSYVQQRGPWACDYCRLATFSTFEDAAKHEESCSMNQNALSFQPNPNHSIPSPHLQYTHHFNRVSSSDSSKTISLGMPSDEDCLSDRQCYVRSNFVELFAATEADVAARHSKGAQKLHVGQIGIRCKHCKSLRSKDRAERAVCYPSSVSRIYQTVADMQRFHFMSCNCIPDTMKESYNKLKTTRPRGVGSPQAYWISSAKEIGLVDTESGIRYEPKNQEMSQFPQYPTRTVSSFSSISSCSTNTHPMNMSPGHRVVRHHQSSPQPMQSSPCLSPLSPTESQSTSHSLSNDMRSDCSDLEMASRDSDANMLLALKNPRPNSNGKKSNQ